MIYIFSLTKATKITFVERKPIYASVYRSNELFKLHFIFFPLQIGCCGCSYGPVLYKTVVTAKTKTLLANCQRNRLAIALRHKSACYIAEVLTFMALLLISCDSLALSYQTTCFYIDKNFISDCLQTAISGWQAMRGTNWAICLLVVNRNYSVTLSSKLDEEKKSFSLIYTCIFSYFSFIMYSFHCLIYNIFFPLLEIPFTADCFSST